MLAWLKSLGQDFQRGFVTYIIVAAGLGAWLLAKLKVIGPAAYDLANSKINISLALLLGALAYLTGRVIGKIKWKPKEQGIKITETPLLQVGNFKWEFTFYSDNTFDVNPVPFCNHHDAKLIEHWPLYFCPVNSNCPSISYTDLPRAQQQAESLMDAHIRKQKQGNA
jgi:hypothetical protein